MKKEEIVSLRKEKCNYSLMSKYQKATLPCFVSIDDVDIESEKYRSIGEARFTLGAVVRIMGECPYVWSSFWGPLLNINRTC